MTQVNTKPLRVNEQIRISPVRVIDNNQNMLGVMPVDEAFRMARDNGMDLVEVSPQERPPVCRIMDYGRHKYLTKKKQKVSKAAHQVQTKEIRLRPGTDTHDLSVKLKHALEFLGEGDKVQFTMLFRGRERAHRQEAAETMAHLMVELGESAKMERAPMMDGKRMVMVVAPGKITKPSQPKPPKAPRPPKPEGEGQGSGDGSARPGAPRDGAQRDGGPRDGAPRDGAPRTDGRPPARDRVSTDRPPPAGAPLMSPVTPPKP